MLCSFSGFLGVASLTRDVRFQNLGAMGAVTSVLGVSFLRSLLPYLYTFFPMVNYGEV